MRNFFTITLLLLVATVAAAQDCKVSLNLHKQPISTFFAQLQQQCDYAIVYSDEVVADTMQVTIQVQNKPVTEVLDKVLRGKQLFYRLVTARMIVISSNQLTKRSEQNFEKVTLTGKVVDVKGQAVPFVSVGLIEDGLPVGGVIGSEQGTFQLSYGFAAHQKYLLKVSSVGYQPASVAFTYPHPSLSDQRFATITLTAKNNMLKEVNVTGSQKLIEVADGNIVFNVSKSINAQGSNALDVLKRAPGVFVDNNNSISLNGKMGAGILIDGKQTYLSGKELAELLRSMSANEIKSIEIINSPSAKYDAAGTAGMINVRTAKSLVQGFSGSFTSGLNYGVFLRNNQDLSFNYRNNKLNIYGNYSHFIGHYSYLYGSDRLQEGKFYNSFTDDVDKRNKMGSRLGADYAINKNHTIGILLNGNFIFGGGITATTTNIGVAQTTQVDQTLSAINDYYAQKTQRYNVNLNYKYEDTLGRILNIDADLGSFGKKAGNLQTNRYTAANDVLISDNLYRSINGISIDLKALKLDYTTNLWKGKLETGAKYSSVGADNDTKFLRITATDEVLDQSRSNRFNYTESIASAYANYKRSIGKWSVQGGLRMENSASKGVLDYNSTIAGNAQSTTRNYTNLFPFFGLTLNPSPSHSISVSYSRRIDRPAYQNLNPFIYLLDELSYWQGNPFLKPQLSHRALLQYVYKSSTILALSYTRTSDFSVEVTDTVDRTKIVMVPRNLGIQQHMALSLTQNLNPYPWWGMVFNGTVFGIKNQIAFDAARELDLQQLAARMNLQQTFKLPYQLTAEVVAVYNSRRLAGANQFAKATSQVDVGLQRNFLSNKATLRLAVSDIYKGSKGRSIQQVAGLYLYNYSYFETRQVKLNFSYKFASGSSKGPRVRNSALDNENGRIK